MTRLALALFFSSLSACDLVAGLGDFQPAEPSGGGGGSGAGDVGAGGLGGVGGVGGSGAGDVGAGGTGGDPSACPDRLVISELRTFGTGRGDDDFVEIHNPTSQTISLHDVSIAARAPGSPISERWRGIDEDMIGPGGYFLIAGEGFDDGPPYDAQLPSFKSFGDDVLVFLRNPSESVIDIVCACTTSCETPDWAGCQGVVLDNPAYVDGEEVETDRSMQRRGSCTDTDSAQDFRVANATPGAPTLP